MMTQEQIAALVGCEVDGSPLKSSIAKLAEDEFKARERVRMLAMINQPIDYDARKKAAIEYAEAQATAIAARRLLDDAIRNS